MARPKKYNWEAIQKAYEEGITINEISKNYGVAKKTLQNKVSEKKWELNGTINNQVNEFKESLERVSGIIGNDSIKQEIVAERLNTIIQDNEIIGNNRKLAKAFQGLVGMGIKNKLYKTPQDIKAGTSTLKDLESVANPQANKQESNININNQNSQQNTEYKIVWE
jgi:hypothetical protein